MMSVSRLLSRSLRLTTLNNTTIRSVFTRSFIGIDGFQKQQKFYEENYKSNLPTIKSAIQEAINNPEGKIFTEDLKFLLYLTNSNEDLDFLVKAIQKYTAQDSSSLFNFNFIPPLMRLLYLMNNTNKAMELFFDEKNAFVRSNITAAYILTNKLLEEKRYDDVIKVYKIAAPLVEKNVFFRLDLNFTEALVEKNDEEALNIGKEYVKSIIKKNLEKPPRMPLQRIFLLALNQKDYEYANELIQHIPIFPLIQGNYKVIVLAHLNRIEEALKQAIEIKTNLKEPNKEKFFFKETIEALKGLIEKTKDDGLKLQLESFTNENVQCIFDTDLRTSTMKVSNYEENVRKQKELNRNRDSVNNPGNREYRKDDRSNERNQRYGNNQNREFRDRTDGRGNERNQRFGNNQNREFRERRFERTSQNLENN